MTWLGLAPHLHIINGVSYRLLLKNSNASAEFGAEYSTEMKSQWIFAKEFP